MHFVPTSWLPRLVSLAALTIVALVFWLSSATAAPFIKTMGGPVPFAAQGAMTDGVLLAHCCHSHPRPPYDRYCCHSGAYVAPVYRRHVGSVRRSSRRVGRRTGRRVSRRRR